mgnify:CR=1 FL=1
MKTYKGKFKPKNTSKYDGDHTNVVYRSLWEKYTFMWCDSNSEIKSWSSEETIVPYISAIDNRAHRYFVDLKITTNEGKVFLIEIKPAKQTKKPKSQRRTKASINESLEYVKNQCKWKAANAYCADRGWKFEIWTENELSKWGILPKSTQKFAPYKRKKSK